MILLFLPGTVWFRAAVAALCLASTPRHLAMDPLLRGRLSLLAALRLWAIMLIASGVFGCIASLLAGGAFGWLGLFVSLFVGVTGASLLRGTQR